MARLFGFILIFAVFLGFIVINLDNKCNVNIGFRSFTDVPVFITVFISLFAGMIFTIPFLSSIKKKSKSQSNSGKKNKKLHDDQDDIPGVNGPYGIN